MIRALLNKIWLKKELWRFERRTKKIDSIYIFDIDNTLANTWVSFTYGFDNEKERLKGLSVFLGMRRFILQLKESGEDVIFLSARNFLYFGLTLNWLNSVGIAVRKKDLFLVNTAAEKLLFLKLLAGKKVVFVDDMSYNQENGEEKLRIELINKIKKLPYVNFWDLKKINEINKV